MWSYRRLPTPMKQCFIYLSLFPKDSKLNKTKIIQMWIAHGYVVQSYDAECCLEDIAKWYFDYLVKVSLVLYVDDNHYLHDLVHDFATSAYKSVHNVSSEPSTKIREPMVVRHLHVHDSGLLLRNYSDIRKLRTFISDLSYSDVVNKLGSDRLKTVRVMQFSHVVRLDLEKLTRSAVDLRYLDLSFSLIISLPESLCSLYNLQTLLLPACIEEFPKNMWKLVNLRHLHRRGYMPIIERIEELTSLQTINGIQISKVNCGKGIRVLRSVVSGPEGLLCISGLRFVRDSGDARYVRFEEKKHIQELYLYMDTLYSDPIETEDQNEETLCKEVLDNLKPHLNLRKLRINNYFGRELPTWLGDDYLCNLQSLSLWRLSSSLENMPPLGLLPKLEVLVIDEGNIKRIGNEIYGGRVEVVFPSLKVIELLSMHRLEEWEELNSEDKCLINKYFPCLRKIIVRDCPYLRCLPHVPRSLESFEISQSGLAHIPKVWGPDDTTAKTCSLPNLKHLSIRGCPELVQTDIKQWVDGITSLEHLLMFGMRKLKKLVLHNHCFLKTLIIKYCPDLSSIDGINDLRALKELRLKYISAGFKVEMDDVNNTLQNLRFLSTNNWEILKAVDPRSLHVLELDFRSNILDLDRDVSCEEHRWLNSWWGNLRSIEKITFTGVARENCPHWILQVKDLHTHIRITFL